MARASTGSVVQLRPVAKFLFARSLRHHVRPASRLRPSPPESRPGLVQPQPGIGSGGDRVRSAPPSAWASPHDPILEVGLRRKARIRPPAQTSTIFANAREHWAFMTPGLGDTSGRPARRVGNETTHFWRSGPSENEILSLRGGSGPSENESSHFVEVQLIGNETSRLRSLPPSRKRDFSSLGPSRPPTSETSRSSEPPGPGSETSRFVELGHRFGLESSAPCSRAFDKHP